MWEGFFVSWDYFFRFWRGLVDRVVLVWFLGFFEGGFCSFLFCWFAVVFQCITYMQVCTGMNSRFVLCLNVIISINGQVFVIDGFKMNFF